MPKKYNYYSVDAGFFNVQIKLCFSNVEFQKILKDHDIPFKADALEVGIGETHYISDGRNGIIVLAFDLEECDQDPATLAGIIAHEATHCACRVFEHIGEEVDEIGEESRAYLTEYIVAQLTQAVIIEKAKNARKASRTVPKQKGKGSGGPELQVDINSNGGAGQNSNTLPEGVLRGIEDFERNLVPKAEIGVPKSRRAWPTRGGFKK
jgi:hypothetical protein